MLDGIIEVGCENLILCVLWNLWIEKLKWLLNFVDDEYYVMLCLEVVNVFDDVVEFVFGVSYIFVIKLCWV